jgi:hypothetical protein
MAGRRARLLLRATLQACAQQPATEEDDMKFMVMVRATAQSEACGMPSAALLAEMGRFNEEMARAGVLLAGEGLHPSARGARIRFSEDGKRSVIDGPFAETKELIAGFWMIQVPSLEEAIAWMQRSPHPFPGGAAELEIRQVFSDEDFGAEFTPELRAQEARIRKQVEAR